MDTARRIEAWLLRQKEMRNSQSLPSEASYLRRPRPPPTPSAAANVNRDWTNPNRFSDPLHRASPSCHSISDVPAAASHRADKARTWCLDTQLPWRRAGAPPSQIPRASWEDRVQSLLDKASIGTPMASEEAAGGSRGYRGSRTWERVGPSHAQTKRNSLCRIQPGNSCPIQRNSLCGSQPGSPCSSHRNSVYSSLLGNRCSGGSQQGSPCNSQRNSLCGSQRTSFCRSPRNSLSSSHQGSPNGSQRNSLYSSIQQGSPSNSRRSSLYGSPGSGSSPQGTLSRLSPRGLESRRHSPQGHIGGNHRSAMLEPPSVGTTSRNHSSTSSHRSSLGMTSWATNSSSLFSRQSSPFSSSGDVSGSGDVSAGSETDEEFWYVPGHHHHHHHNPHHHHQHQQQQQQQQQQHQQQHQQHPQQQQHQHHHHHQQQHQRALRGSALAATASSVGSSAAGSETDDEFLYVPCQQLTRRLGALCLASPSSGPPSPTSSDHHHPHHHNHHHDQNTVSHHHQLGQSQGFVDSTNGGFCLEDDEDDFDGCSSDDALSDDVFLDNPLPLQQPMARVTPSDHFAIKMRPGEESRGCQASGRCHGDQNDDVFQDDPLKHMDPPDENAIGSPRGEETRGLQAFCLSHEDQDDNVFLDNPQPLTLPEDGREKPSKESRSWMKQEPDHSREQRDDDDNVFLDNPQPLTLPEDGRENPSKESRSWMKQESGHSREQRDDVYLDNPPDVTPPEKNAIERRGWQGQASCQRNGVYLDNPPDVTPPEKNAIERRDWHGQASCQRQNKRDGVYLDNPPDVTTPDKKAIERCGWQGQTSVPSRGDQRSEGQNDNSDNASDARHRAEAEDDLQRRHLLAVESLRRNTLQNKLRQTWRHRRHKAAAAAVGEPPSGVQCQQAAPGGEPSSSSSSSSFGTWPESGTGTLAATGDEERSSRVQLLREEPSTSYSSPHPHHHLPTPSSPSSTSPTTPVAQSLWAEAADRENQAKQADKPRFYYVISPTDDVNMPDVIAVRRSSVELIRWQNSLRRRRRRQAKRHDMGTARKTEPKSSPTTA